MTAPAWTAPQFPNMTVTHRRLTEEEAAREDRQLRDMRDILAALERHARPVTYYPELPDDYPRN